MTTTSVPGLFGKAPPRLDPRTLTLRSVAGPGTIGAPPSLGWTQQTEGWGMLGNDTYPDCVQAAILHQDEIWTRLARPDMLHLFQDDSAIGLWQHQTTSHLDDPQTWVGTVYLDALKDWRQSQSGWGGPLWGFGALDWTDHQQMTDAIYAFGGVQLGFSFPADMDFSLGYWVPTGHSGDASRGHGVCVVDYDPDWYWCISWGRLYAMSRDFVRVYGDEAYFCVSEDWQHDPTTPAGKDLAALRGAFSAALIQATA